MKKQTLTGYLLLLPSLILISALILGPVLQTIYQSFFNIRTQTIAFGYDFVGLSNYKNIFQDEYFLKTIKWTLQFTFISVFFEIILATALALLMNKEMKGQSMIRLTILLPWAIPVIVAGIVWTKIFAYNGIVNTVLIQIGIISEAINFFGVPLYTKFAVILTEVWKSTPYLSLLILAGLIMIPKEYYEAAQIDGAGKIQRFLRITLPCLLPVLSVTILFRIITVLRAYGLMVAMTGGGPGGETQTVAMYAVDSFFRHGKISYGSAVSLVMLMISTLMSLFFIRSLKNKV